MALVFPPSLPSWVYGSDGTSKLVMTPEAFAELSPAEWADHPHDFTDAPDTPAAEPTDAPEAPGAVDAPVKRGPGRPRKVVA